MVVAVVAIWHIYDVASPPQKVALCQLRIAVVDAYWAVVALVQCVAAWQRVHKRQRVPFTLGAGACAYTPVVEPVAELEPF